MGDPTWRTRVLAHHGGSPFSRAAAISNRIYRSNDLSGRIVKSREASLQLDRLQTLLELGQVSAGDAIKQ
jgi:C4-type Zn-finger protein